MTDLRENTQKSFFEWAVSSCKDMADSAWEKWLADGEEITLRLLAKIKAITITYVLISVVLTTGMFFYGRYLGAKFEREAAETEAKRQLTPVRTTDTTTTNNEPIDSDDSEESVSKVLRQAIASRVVYEGGRITVPGDFYPESFTLSYTIERDFFEVGTSEYPDTHSSTYSGTFLWLCPSNGEEVAIEITDLDAESEEKLIDQYVVVGEPNEKGYGKISVFNEPAAHIEGWSVKEYLYGPHQDPESMPLGSDPEPFSTPTPLDYYPERYPNAP